MSECPGRGQPLDNARERAEYDGPGLELERSVDWSGATKRSVDWSGTPEGGVRDRESQGYVSSSCYM